VSSTRRPDLERAGGWGVVGLLGGLELTRVDRQFGSAVFAKRVCPRGQSAGGKGEGSTGAEPTEERRVGGSGGWGWSAEPGAALAGHGGWQTRGGKGQLGDSLKRRWPSAFLRTGRARGGRWPSPRSWISSGWLDGRRPARWPGARAGELASAWTGEAVLPQHGGDFERGGWLGSRRPARRLGAHTRGSLRQLGRGKAVLPHRTSI
jgi:hypothetical protein